MAACWKCHRDLGPMLEHQKMVTEKGPICFACFNATQEEEVERTSPVDRPEHDEAWRGPTDQLTSSAPDKN